MSGDKLVTSTTEDEGHASFVEYKTLYVVSYDPPEMIPKSGSIIAPSSGVTLNEKDPPGTPNILAIPPSQVAAISKKELSGFPKFIITSSET